MSTRIIFLASFAILLFTSCNNKSKTDAEDTSKQNDSPVVVKDATKENEALPDRIRQSTAEINNYRSVPSMHEDSMSIVYKGVRDTIFGFRAGDTLYTEGDIKVTYTAKGAKGVGTTDKLWDHHNGRIIIPYVISSTYSHRDRIKAAFDLWNVQLPAIRFIERTIEDDYILFMPSQFTQSNVGKIGNVQTIELAEWAISGNIAHEIGHVLGLYHEHTRADRDTKVQVQISCTDNINYRHAFKMDPYAIDIGEYDYNSIMQYPQTECLSFPSLPKGINPGQRISISDGDALTIRRIYRL
ncbi:M12 family metallopeptidase [Ferruginibacter paludis]|uniref:M12 family metallopeptidase n=1 Tax=Ferruginibacter paludis TaxID=1310417 RepID=UPI0025B529B8|nr:M12 family metallopeptidase [Ferruginibacter paludis]MDN3658668.1 M12 family metallopeptidase [Ferruginibacter paludis]